MSGLPHPGQDAVPFTTLTAQFYDETIENIESLSNGTGFADHAIPSIALNLSKTVDANGWTVYDYGNFKEYKLKIEVAGINAIAANGVFLPAAFTSVALPIGISNMSTKHLDATLCCQFAGGFVANSEKSGGSGNNPSTNTTLRFPIYNALASSVAPGDVCLYLTITDK